MKIFVLLMTAATLFIVGVAIFTSFSSDPVEPVGPRASVGQDVTVWTDVTGCQYLVFDGYQEMAVTPRLKAGEPMCSEDDL